MPTACEFVFSRPSSIFYSGEHIQGIVRFNTTKRLELTGIKLLLVGTIQVQWSERTKDAIQNIEHNDCACAPADTQKCYSAKENCFRDWLRLSDDVTLEAGSIFTEHFCFSVSDQCPATCKLDYGEIAYELQLLLQCKSICNKMYQKRVVIRNKVDLNRQPKLKEPNYIAIQGVGNKSLGFLNFGVPNTGYVPGQLIKYHLEYPLIVDHKKIAIELCQTVIYKSFEPIIHSKQVTKVVASDAIVAGREYNDGCLRIPLEMPLTSINRHLLIHISYHIRLLVVGKKKRVLKRVGIPITIGSVPLQIDAKLAAESIASFAYDNFASNAVESVSSFKTENSANFSHQSLLETFTKDVSGDFYQNDSIRITDRIKLLRLTTAD